MLATLGLVAAAVATVVLAPVADRGAGGARLTATATDGSFTQSNSRDGLPLFSASGIAPGDSVGGTVTLTNTGTLAGRFTLSATDVTDVAGSGGGLLSERLQASIEDVTAPSAPVAVYAGALGAMAPRDLGVFSPGESRTFELVATLPDGGAPPDAESGDNAFQDAQASVRYVWTAVEEEPTAPPPASPPPASPPPATAPEDDAPDGRDSRAPRLRMRVPRVQRVFRTRRLAVRVRCGERCRIRAGGWLRAGRGRRLRLPPSRARARARDARLVRIRVPLRHRRVLRSALVRDRTVTIRIVVKASDRTGNVTVLRRMLRARGR